MGSVREGSNRPQMLGKDGLGVALEAFPQATLLRQIFFQHGLGKRFPQKVTLFGQDNGFAQVRGSWPVSVRAGGRGVSWAMPSRAAARITVKAR